MAHASGEWQEKPTEEIPPTAMPVVEASQAYLVRLGGERAGERLVVGDSLTIGRQDGVEMQLRGSDVSRLHARISRLPSGEHLIEDLGSRNGTVVNGLPVMMHVLRFGDTIHIGPRAGFIYTHHNPVEQQLLAAERVEGVAQLAGGIAHHINNLLSVMLSNLGYLQELPPATTLADGQVDESLTDMRSAVGRASSIVRQLSAYARQRSRERDELDLSGLLHEVVGGLRRRAGGARIEAEVEPGLSIPGDPEPLRDIFEHLGDNAVEATGGEGRVVFGGRQRDIPLEEALVYALPTVGPHIEVWVRDSGAGMDETTRERAFEPFFSTKGPTRGTGLGLAAVYGTVKAHGGFVRVESSLGQGTTIWVYLPLSGAQQRPEPTPARLVRSVVLVAAGLARRGLLEQALGDAGRRALFVDEGRSLVMRFLERRHEVGLVLVDSQLRGLAVMETLRLLRQSDPDLRLIVCVEDPATVPAFAPDLGVELVAADDVAALAAKLRHLTA